MDALRGQGAVGGGVQPQLPDVLSDAGVLLGGEPGEGRGVTAREQGDRHVGAAGGSQQGGPQRVEGEVLVQAGDHQGTRGSGSGRARRSASRTGFIEERDGEFLLVEPLLGQRCDQCGEPGRQAAGAQQDAACVGGGAAHA